VKIDKSDPRHWGYLIASLAWVLLAIAWRPLRRGHRGGRRRVLLYGHKLNGNLLPLYRALRADPRFDAAFLSLDPAYARALVAAGEEVVDATSPRCVPWLGRVDALVSDHGLHALRPLLRLSDVKFFDVWHGIPFKGFDADDFRVQHAYDEAWVASPLLAALYVAKFGFARGKVVATGYARTDRLVRGEEDSSAARAALGLPPGGKVILFAPTWAQDDRGRSLFPFGCDEGVVMGALSAWAVAHEATIVLRTHLNSRDTASAARPGVTALPAADFPDTERILLASDVLVCDWSSIAFDFLLLDRPAVFLDVAAPFRKGFSLGPEYRYGSIASGLPGLLDALSTIVRRPDAYWTERRARHDAVRADVYGACADGAATQRCIAQLASALAPGS
jgi:CDP-glycerol glycerophosphotransferase